MDKQQKLIISLTAAFLVLVAVIILLVYGAYSNWFKTGFEHIYLKSGGERLQQSEIYRLGNTQLDVSQFGGKRGFSVKIVAASDEDFTYTVDGKYFNYIKEISEKDLTKIFGVESDKRSIFIHARDIYVLDVLQAVYPESDVQLVSIPQQPVLYKMIVTNKSGKHSFELTFCCRIPVTGIELDSDHVFADLGGFYAP